MKRVRLGLVGAGAFGEFCLEAFARMPEVNIVAVADSDRDRATLVAGRFGAKAYFDLDALLGDAEVELVALNTPPFLHGVQGARILSAGKHLFCEKPLALNLQEAGRLLQIASQKNLALCVNYVMRHNPLWQATAALRKSGVFGALRHLDLANHAAGLSLPASHWFWDTARSGGIWIEHGVHFFDAFAWVSGQQGKVKASTCRRRGDGAIDRVEALVQYGDADAHFYHAFDQSAATEHTTVRLSFERASLTLREWVPTTLELETPVDPGLWRRLLRGEVAVEPLQNQLTRATARLGPKAAVYRDCVQAGLRSMSAEGSTSRSLAEAAYASLQTAVEATEVSFC